ncbi:hypothetical protein [uncultured Amphritea sp.]|uniref:hypothetical protein n=1 Tax=uncultured Amphritea sp. TaxID=981605 RepID=UPI00262B781B|nr:hypothetical protein [uncultured Amphritea sp.]
MKSYLFTTETDRGGVMLCEIEDFDTAVKYLCNRFDGVVKIESAEQVWELPEADKLAVQAPTVPEIAAPAGSVTPDAAPEPADLFG